MDKVQLVKHSNVFQMWKMSGGRDWRPLLRGLLGQNVVAKMEMVARNAYLKGPKSYWTYPGDAASFNDLDSTKKFSLDIVNAWNLRLGNIGSPVIPGEMGSAKLCLVPPGVIFDFFSSLAGSSANEASMWRDAKLYKDVLPYEIGSFKNVRFVEVPNDRYGLNPAILYNAGPISKQVAIIAAVTAGDGAPDPETTKVDEVWNVGQKNVTHYISCDAFTTDDFKVNDVVTIHTLRTSDYGVTNGVHLLSGKTIQRRVVKVTVDAYTETYQLAFDRPIMSNYNVDLDAPNGTYGYVTKGTNVAFNLTLGSRGGIKGNINKPLEFYEPRPIDDFDSVWRFSWDIIAGMNLWEPTLFECHFSAVSLPKPGGVIAPPA